MFSFHRCYCCVCCSGWWWWWWWWPLFVSYRWSVVLPPYIVQMPVFEIRFNFGNMFRRLIECLRMRGRLVLGAFLQCTFGLLISTSYVAEPFHRWPVLFRFRTTTNCCNLLVNYPGHRRSYSKHFYASPLILYLLFV